MISYKSDKEKLDMILTFAQEISKQLEESLNTLDSVTVICKTY